MRIARLDLTRYGKFTGHSLDLPAAERDFHLIVGPNEAGKSTVRAAVLDLLYGIPPRTAHAFLHAMPDLRLGARLTQRGEALELQRVKGNKQTLRDVDDKPLPDLALAPYLGATDREFYAQMFGLDHERLVKGGHSILSAANDLGQILFQSAAGIAGLGTVRDALEAEADKLWSRRRSGERSYYIAADELERATAALKLATVRTKDWAEAQARLAELDTTHADVRQQHAAVKARRSLLERVRRVLPHLAAVDEATAQITALGPVAELPDDAAQTLADAQRTLAAAQVDIGHQCEQKAQAQTALGGLTVDGGIRAAGPEITELNEQRLQYRAYAGDIAQRQSEIDAQWGLAAGLAAGLGWPVDTPEAVRARLPSAPVREALLRLIRSHAALQQGLAAAQRAERAKRAELVQAGAALARLPASALPLALQAALVQAQKLGDFEAGLRERQQAVRQRESALEVALAALGAWRMDTSALRAMAPPAVDTVKSLAQQQVHDDAQARTVQARLQTLAQQVQQARLAVEQYRRAHEPVTREEVLGARQQRDQTWHAAKASAAMLAQHGAVFEQQVVAADLLADRRHDTVQQASELQARLAQVERTQQELSLVNEELAAVQAGSEARTQQWARLAAECGLPGLPFQAAAPWLEARTTALAAQLALDEARAASQALEAAGQAAHATLARELEQAGVQAEGATLAVLMLHAEGHVHSAAESAGQRRTLERQQADGERDLTPLAQELRLAGEALDDWSTHWHRLLAEAGLVPTADPVSVEALLDAAERIAAALANMQKTQVERVDKMRADLAQHALAARALAERVAPALADQPAAEIALGLAARLATANEAHVEAERQRAALQVASGKLDEAMLKRAQAEATLAPLLQRAGLPRHEELPAAVEKNERRRTLAAASDVASRALLQGGDGCSAEQLRAEAAGVDATALLAELGELTAQDEALVERLAELSAQRQAATTVLQAMGGTADAARAESQRQEALASMADTVERYVKVFTASRLLRWSIEQYREAKQGPMLSSASRIFARLTGGSFEKLTVDFESEPLKLMGRRPNGAEVAIEGMSEGTRDQLFLALRLAALDDYLGQAQVLPFIADDLFINYDDQRSTAGLEALAELSRKTQVLFLTHHEHLLPAVQQVFGSGVNVVRLSPAAR